MTPNYMKLLGLEDAAKRCKNREAFNQACVDLRPRMEHFGLSEGDYAIYCQAAWRSFRVKPTRETATRQTWSEGMRQQ